jgi:RimJ/RimL family protein N-acetyltransferase
VAAAAEGPDHLYPHPLHIGDLRLELVPYTADDAWLTEALETDPRVMAELGGPWPKEKIAGIHERRLAAIAKGAWAFKVVPESGGTVVGTVSLWDSEHAGQPISEAGWMILPEHQGRGYASEALRLMLEMAKADGRWGDIHAFPGATNAPSNALCRKLGFELIEQVEIDYADRFLTCNHWVLRA